MIQYKYLYAIFHIVFIKMYMHGQNTQYQMIEMELVKIS